MGLPQQRYLYTDSKYEYTLEIIFTETPLKALKGLYKKWDIDEDLIDGDAYTVVCENKAGDYIDNSRYGLIFSYRCLTPNIIAHECTHLAAFILEARNIDLPGKDSKYENMCWVVGHLTEMVTNLAEKLHIPIYKSNFPSKLKKLG